MNIICWLFGHPEAVRFMENGFVNSKGELRPGAQSYCRRCGVTDAAGQIFYRRNLFQRTIMFQFCRWQNKCHFAKLHASQRSPAEITLELMRKSRELDEAVAKHHPYVAVKVGDTHCGVLGGLILVLKLEDVRATDPSIKLEKGLDVFFCNPVSRGWSWGKVLFFLNGPQSWSIVELARV